LAGGGEEEEEMSRAEVLRAEVLRTEVLRVEVLRAECAASCKHPYRRSLYLGLISVGVAAWEGLRGGLGFRV